MYKQKIELRHLQYFALVAQELHFSRAAEKLHIAQPPLSQQILQLEQIVGVRLFERNHRSVALTNAGQVFLKEILPILKQVEYALVCAQKAQQGLIGKLSLGYVRHAPGAESFLPSVVSMYRQRFPGVDIDLREMKLHEQSSELREQNIQIGYTLGLKNQGFSTDFHSEVVQHLPVMVVCALQHRLAAQPSVMLRDLARESFVSLSRQEACPFYDRVVQICGFSPHVLHEVPDVPMLLGLIAANVAIGLIPVSPMLLQHPGVVCCPLADTDVDITFEALLIWGKRETSPLVQAFLTVAREELEKQKKEGKR